MRVIAKVAILFGLAIFGAGCAATSPAVSEWRKADFGGPAFVRVMVAGPGSSASLRRQLEDEWLSQLHAAGVDAVASYRYLPEDDKLSVETLGATARQARATALLVVRSVQTEQKIHTSGASFPWLSVGVFGSHVGASVHGLGGAPSSSRYQEQASETALYDAAKNEMVWSGTVRTQEPESSGFAAKKHVEAALRALDAQRLLRRDQ